MEAPAQPPVSTGRDASLTGIRIAAALGLVVGVAIVVFAFTVAWWLGTIALFLVPAVPMGFVLATEAARRDP